LADQSLITTVIISLAGQAGLFQVTCDDGSYIVTAMVFVFLPIMSEVPSEVSPQKISVDL